MARLRRRRAPARRGGGLVVRSQRTVPIRCVNRTTSLLIWWADSPDAWEPSVRIRPLGADLALGDLEPLALGAQIGRIGLGDRAHDGLEQFERDLRLAGAAQQQGLAAARLLTGTDLDRRRIGRLGLVEAAGRLQAAGIEQLHLRHLEAAVGLAHAVERRDTV